MCVCVSRAAAPAEPFDIEKLDPIQPIGYGGFGGVWLAEQDCGSHAIPLAVKQIKKRFLVQKGKKAANRILLEREALLECGSHPFISTCLAAFQDATSLFLVLELAPGGRGRSSSGG